MKQASADTFIVKRGDPMTGRPGIHLIAAGATQCTSQAALLMLVDHDDIVLADDNNQQQPRNQQQSGRLLSDPLSLESKGKASSSFVDRTRLDASETQEGVGRSRRKECSQEEGGEAGKGGEERWRDSIPLRSGAGVWWGWAVAGCHGHGQLSRQGTESSS
ncbi:hypothetical protein AXG93_2982s1040 [Marchantia polymorpha subsp. ruderalis]|uniref:Uncharacterized protein n=1 Tax=Marchantia polymorpha subsp. ruderalis TaxID=1480154 RepID=A0A176VXP1_MARPO|nr:hypothetical protein AXG93_2982s1040 [Marchantia polymorpha subsp. ruderalis]